MAGVVTARASPSESQSLSESVSIIESYGDSEADPDSDHLIPAAPASQSVLFQHTTCRPGQWVNASFRSDPV
jgi:hypothetical protein